MLGTSDLVQVLPFVGDIAVEHEGSRINRRLEGALSRSQRRAVLRSVLYAHSLDSLAGHRLCGSILSEKLGVRHSRIIEGDVIVHGTIEVFSVRRMSRVIVLGALHVEVRDPAQFTINVPLLAHLGVIRHSGTLHVVHFEWVQFSSWFQQDWLFLLECFVKVLLVVCVIIRVENRWAEMMSLVPLIVIWGQHAIVRILVDDELGRSLSVGGVTSLKLSMCSKDISKPLTSEWRFAIDRSNWRSQLRINYNVFCV